MKSAPCLHFSITVWILTLEPNAETTVVPNSGPTTLGALWVFRFVQGRRAIAPTHRRAYKAPELVTGRGALDAKHAFVRVLVRKYIKRSMPQNSAIENSNLFMHPRAQIDDHAERAQPTHELYFFFWSAATGFAGRLCQDADSDTPQDSSAEELHPTTHSIVGRKW